LQIGRQIVWIVGKGLQIVAAEHQRARIVGRIGGDGGGIAVLNNHMLRGGYHIQLEIQGLGSCTERYGRNARRYQIRRGACHSIGSWHKAYERIGPVAVGCGGLDLSAGTG